MFGRLEWFLLTKLWPVDRSVRIMTHKCLQMFLLSRSKFYKTYKIISLHCSPLICSHFLRLIFSNIAKQSKRVFDKKTYNRAKKEYNTVYVTRIMSNGLAAFSPPTMGRSKITWCPRLALLQGAGQFVQSDFARRDLVVLTRK